MYGLALSNPAVSTTRSPHRRHHRHISCIQQVIKLHQFSTSVDVGLPSQVQAFILEGIAMEGRDKRKLTLPPSDKAQRTQVHRYTETLQTHRYAIYTEKQVRLATAIRHLTPDFSRFLAVFCTRIMTVQLGVAKWLFCD